MSNNRLPAPGKDGLKVYDPAVYELVDKIYSGSTSPTKVILAFPISPWPLTAKEKQNAFVMIVNDTPDILELLPLNGR